MTTSAPAATAMTTLANGDKFDIKDKGILGGDIRWVAALAVGVVGRDVKSGLLANSHGRHALVPAADDLAHADGELKAVVRVEALPGGKVAVVVDLDEVALRRLFGVGGGGGGDDLLKALLVGLAEVEADGLVLLPVLDLVLLGAVHHTPAPGAELGGLELLAECTVVATACHFFLLCFLYFVLFYFE